MFLKFLESGLPETLRVDNATSHQNKFVGVDKFHGSTSQQIWLIVGTILGIIGFVLLVSLILWLIRRRIARSRAGQAVDPELALVPPPVPPPAQGLGLTVIGTLPVIAYPPPPRRHGEMPDSTCPICLEDFSIGAEIRVLPCHHFYHPACIEDALLLRPICPYCGQTVTVADV